MRVGFIGTGRMGEPMARNLLRAGHTVTVFNRTRARAERLVEDGAHVAREPVEAAANADVVITMLADDAALESVMPGSDGVGAGLAPDAIHVSMGTISVALSRRLAEDHGRRGQGYVAAPVFGRPDAAEAAKLFIVAAGTPAAIVRSQPLFDALGQRTIVLGSDAPAANVVKLTGNFILATAVESMGEAFALARTAGVDPEAYLDLLTSTVFTAPLYKTYGAMIAADRYEPAGFPLALGLKDVKLALAAAEDAGVPMPLAGVLRDRMRTGVARGLGDADLAALGRVAAEEAGSYIRAATPAGLARSTEHDRDAGLDDRGSASLR